MMTSARGGAYDSSKHLRHQTALQNLPLDASWDNSNYSEINKTNQKEDLFVALSPGASMSGSLGVISRVN